MTLSVAPAWIREREIQILGVLGFRERDLREAMRMIDGGTLNAESYVSRRTPWADLEHSGLDPAPTAPTY